MTTQTRWNPLHVGIPICVTMTTRTRWNPLHVCIPLCKLRSDMLKHNNISCVYAIRCTPNKRPVNHLRALQ